MCKIRRETIEVSSPEELRKLISELPEGTICTIRLEMIMAGEKEHGKDE